MSLIALILITQKSWLGRAPMGENDDDGFSGATKGNLTTLVSSFGFTTSRDSNPCH